MDFKQGFLSMRTVIYPWHCDINNHMNVMYYTGKFDEATWCFFDKLGIDKQVFHEHNQSMVAVEQITKYSSEVSAGDILEVYTELLEVKDKALIFIHSMYNKSTKKLAATAQFTGVHFDLTTRKGIAFSPELRQGIDAFFEGQ